MPEVKPYSEKEGSKKEQVQEMFDKVSSKYDFLNRVLSFGIDINWRNKVVKLVANEKPKKVMDLATGTGDLAIEIAKKIPNTDVLGFDLSDGMLDVGRGKINKLKLDSRIKMQQGDAEKMPFANGEFDVVTVAFGVRNFENLESGLKEIHRVLKPGGKMVILEFSQPDRFPMKQLYGIYSKYVLPNIGKLISDDKMAYDYLPNSIKAFPYGEKMVSILKKCSFDAPYCKELTFGISSIYVGTK